MPDPRVVVNIHAADRFSKNFKRARNAVGAFGKQHANTMRRVQRSAGGARNIIKGIATAYLGIQGIRLVARGISGLVNLNRQFEDSIASATAKFGGMAEIGEDGMAAMREAVRSVGRTTEFTAVQAAEGMEFLAMAGFDVYNSAAALPKVIDLATAANVDLARATDIATDTLGAFGLQAATAAEQAAQLTRVNDVMAKTATTANTDLEPLFEAFVNAAPTATSLGINIESLSATLGVLANAGIKGSEAGNAMKRVLLQMGAPTTRALGSLEQLGINIFDVNGNMKDIVDIIGLFEDATSGLTQKQRAFHIEAIFGKRAITPMNILLQEGADKLREYRGELYNAGGAASEMAEIIRDTLTGSLATMKSKLKDVVLEEGTMFNQYLKENIDRFNDWMQFGGGAAAIGDALKVTLDGLVSTMKVVISVVSKVVTFFQEYGSFILFLIKTIGPLIAIQWALNIAMAANPVMLTIVLITAAIAVLGVAIMTIAKNWHKIQNALVKSFKFIKKMFMDYIAKPIVKTFTSIFASIIKVIQRVGGFLGFDTSGLDRLIDKANNIGEDFGKTREERLNDIRDRTESPLPQGPVYGNPNAISGSVDVNINNNTGNPVDVRTSGGHIASTMNTGPQRPVVYGGGSRR